MASKNELTEEMKKILTFIQSNNGKENGVNQHKQEIEKISPEFQKEMYEFMTSELNSMLSFCIAIHQIQNDPDTALGSLHS